MRAGRSRHTIWKNFDVMQEQHTVETAAVRSTELDLRTSNQFLQEVLNFNYAVGAAATSRYYFKKHISGWQHICGFIWADWFNYEKAVEDKKARKANDQRLAEAASIQADDC